MSKPGNKLTNKIGKDIFMLESQSQTYMPKWPESILARIPSPSSEGRVTGEHAITPVISFMASWLTKISLGAAILFTPFRSRLVLYEWSFPTIYEDYTNGLVFISDIFLILTLIFWGIDLLSFPRKITLGPLVISFPLLGLLLTSLMSIFVSSVPLVSTYHFARMLLLGIFYLFMVNQIHDLKSIVIPIAAGTAIQSIVAVTQVLVQRSIGLQSLGEYLLDPAWKGISIVYAQGVRSLRAYGLSDHPNILGGCLAFSLILLISWQIMKKSNREVVWTAVILIGLVGLLLTFSRSAWLGFVLGMLLVGGILWKTRRFREITQLISLSVAGLIVIAPFLVYSAPYLGVRLNQANAFHEVENEARALEERSALNSAGNEIFVANALTGVGIGMSPIAIMQHKPVFPYYYQPPHNTFLDAAVETGIFGAMFYGLLIVGPWFVMILRRKRMDFSPIFVGATGVLLAVTVVGFFDYYTWYLAPGRFWQFFVWGLWGSFYQSSLRLNKND